MGTRHRQAVINKDGELKIQQYGQWDGYPEGQGVDILNYLRRGNLDKYQQNLDKISIITEEQVDRIEKDSDWDVKYHYLSRDCGSKIHKMIEDGVVEFVQHTSLDECNKWCEGFYTIDFERGVFVSEYNGKVVELSINNLPTVRQYKKMFNNKQNNE